MRNETAKHYATHVIQYERVSGGKIWDNPENALASNGNIGAAITNVLYTEDESRPFGPGYFWAPTSNLDSAPSTVTYVEPTLTSLLSSNSINPLFQISPPSFITDPNDFKRYPNSLRFSGFNIDDIGVTGDCIVTNLIVYLEYSDTSYLPIFSTFPEGKRSYSNWNIRPSKSGNVKLYNKRFDGICSMGKRVRSVRIPCMKDQSWHTNTIGPDITHNKYLSGQRFRPAVEGWIDSPTDYGNHYCNEYYESVEDIKPLTVAEINDPNFYIDIWYSRFKNISGNIKVYSLAIAVEYVKPHSCSATLYCHGTAYTNVQQSCRSLKFSPTSLSWTNPWMAALPNAPITSNSIELIGNYDANINVFYNPVSIFNTGGLRDQLKRFDTDMLIGRLDAIPTIDDTKNSITDMILEIRHNGQVKTLFPWNTPRVRWSYFLFNGYDEENSSFYGDPPRSHQLQFFDPGIRISDKHAGQEWLRWTGGYNLFENEYYGCQDNWFFKQIPIKRFNPNYCSESVSRLSRGVGVYNPYWIEKALKHGLLYVGIVLSVDPGFSIYHTISPKPRWNIRINSIRLRVNYDCNDQPPPSLTTSSGLLIRNTP